MNVRDLKATYTLTHKLEPWLHGDVDQKATDDMIVTDLMMNVPYPDRLEATCFLTAGGWQYVTMVRLHGQQPRHSMETWKIREDVLMANMDLWTKRFKPAIKKLLKAGVTVASDIAEQAFVSEAQMRWFLDGYYGGEIFEKDGVEHVRLPRS